MTLSQSAPGSHLADENRQTELNRRLALLPSRTEMEQFRHEMAAAFANYLDEWPSRKRSS